MIQKEKLILLRKEKRLTQMQVAEEIKVSRQAVSGWETLNGSALHRKSEEFEYFVWSSSRPSIKRRDKRRE